jgi:phospholipid/cholesterol/gamma-HCH transport system substrate-binding protein
VRRLALITLTIAAAIPLGAVAFSQSAQGSSTTRFDVIFDDARGLIGGQLVKIAGAKAGTIDNVVVTPDFKARIEATVDSRFVPFHQNATCTIRPEGLIAENYVDCDPGTADSPPLLASGGHPPTVPVTNTTEPVSLLDLFNMFNVPTRQRFQVIVDELGIGTSARGQDFNDILRRANPALALARKVIAILERQKAQLATIIDATNTIASEGASHTASLQNFLDRAAALSTLTASHSSPLALAVNRLPGLLAAAQPSLQQLDTVAVDGTPLLQQLQVAAPVLNRVANDLGPFVKVAKPGLADLGVALKKAIPAIRDTTPLTRTLRSYTHRSLPGTLLFAKLGKNLQQHGFVENFLAVTYYIGATLSRFDATSHMLAILLVGAHNGLCGNYSTTPVAGCSAHYGQQPAYKPSAALARRAATTSAFGRSAAASSAPSLAPPGQAAGATQTPSPGPAVASTGGASSQPGSPGAAATQQATQTLKNLVNYLLR